MHYIQTQENKPDVSARIVYCHVVCAGTGIILTDVELLVLESASNFPLDIIKIHEKTMLIQVHGVCMVVPGSVCIHEHHVR